VLIATFVIAEGRRHSFDGQVTSAVTGSAAAAAKDNVRLKKINDTLSDL
jgi:hypothetical protein